MRAVQISWYKWEHRFDVSNRNYCNLINTGLTHKLSIISQFLFIPFNKYGVHKSKLGGGHRNEFCFTIREISDLVVSLFHE